MSIPPYHRAPSTWSYTRPNPFTPDGTYGNAWSAFCILDSPILQFVTGQAEQGPFSARFGRNMPGLEHHLADFLRYEQTQGRQVILCAPPDIDLDAYVAWACATTPAPHIVRPEDPPVLVHSTSLAAWERIYADGALKAASQLPPAKPQSAQENDPLDDYLSHEPSEYRDYIMFGEIEPCGPEMVVASYQAGRFIMDELAIYQPGVRLYVDSHSIIRDGLGVRDGLHTLKVHRRLTLRSYLIAAVGAGDLRVGGEPAPWTLREFVDQANAAMRFRLEQQSRARSISQHEQIGSQ